MKNINNVGPYILLPLISGYAATVHALDNGNILSFDPGVLECVAGIGTPPNNCAYGTQVTSGSYFALDVNGDGIVQDSEKLSISPGPDGGIILGALQPATGSHFGCPDGSENASVDSPWCFFNNTGMHQIVTSPVTQNMDGSLNFAGWSVTWNGIPSIPLGGCFLGSPANNGGFSGCDLNQDGIDDVTDTGNAVINCSTLPCQVGDAYTLDYSAHVPMGDVSNFGGVGYYLHLESGSVPVAEVSINIGGGPVQECVMTGGSTINFDADINIPNGGSISQIDWKLDGLSVSNDLNISQFVALGRHTISVTVTTANGLVANSIANVTVKDTVGPVITADFVNSLTGLPVDKLNRRNKLEIDAEAIDACDPSPAVQSMIGANVNDGDKVRVNTRYSKVSLFVDQLDLTVHATDSSNNSSTFTKSLLIAQ